MQGGAVRSRRFDNGQKPEKKPSLSKVRSTDKDEFSPDGGGRGGKSIDKSIDDSGQPGE